MGQCAMENFVKWNILFGFYFIMEMANSSSNSF